MNCEKITQHINAINLKLSADCKLIVVSKYRSSTEIKCAYEHGIRAFAENRVQPLLERKEELPADIEWHLIGHLQSNKVKYIAPFIHTIHSVDSVKLLKEIDKEAKKANRVINCLLQVHVAMEDTKFGIPADEFISFVKALDPKELPNVLITGIMAMASNTENESQIRQEFQMVQSLFDEAKSYYKQDYFNDLSIGMTGDYELAQSYGSTMVRIGSGVFG